MKRIDPFGWLALAAIVAAGVCMIAADRLLGGKKARRGVRP